MSSQRDVLGIVGHRLVSASMEDDSVTLWRCLDCRREFDCVSGALETDCTTQPDETRDD